MAREGPTYAPNDVAGAPLQGQISGPMWDYLGIFGPTWAYLCLSRPWAYLGL
jgi:hypothetical protein